MKNVLGSFNIEIAYSTSLSVAPELLVSLSSHEKCPNFKKASTSLESGSVTPLSLDLHIVRMAKVAKMLHDTVKNIDIKFNSIVEMFYVSLRGPESTFGHHIRWSSGCHNLLPLMQAGIGRHQCRTRNSPTAHITGAVM